MPVASPLPLFFFFISFLISPKLHDVVVRLQTKDVMKEVKEVEGKCIPGSSG